MYSCWTILYVICSKLKVLIRRFPLALYDYRCLRSTASRHFRKIKQLVHCRRRRSKRQYISCHSSVKAFCGITLQWRHNERDGVSNFQPHVCLLTVYSGAHQRKHRSSSSLASVWRNHRWPVNSPHKWPVTRKMFPFDDAIVRQNISCHLKC